MANVQERMEMIGSSILAQARSESKALIEKANYEREHELARFEEQMIQEMFGAMQRDTARIRVGTAREISEAQAQARRTLLKNRSGIADSVFVSARKMLGAYVKTPEYAAAVLEEIRLLEDAYDHTYSTVFLSGADMGMAGEISLALKGARIEPDANIRIGGWRLANSGAGVLIDETLDARLEGQREWFLANSGLAIT